MARFPRRRPRWSVHVPGGLTASGSRVVQEQRTPQAESLRRLSLGWQDRAFLYYDLLGEVKQATEFYSRTASAVRLFAAERDDQGKIKETKDKAAIDAFERIQDPGGGREALQGAYGKQMFLAGESLLFVTENQDTKQEQWEMLSRFELKIDARNRYRRLRAPGDVGVEYEAIPDDAFEPVEDKNAVAYHLRRPHPKFSHQPDAPMRSVLDICEELVLLTQGVRARIRSRLAAAGILLVNGKLLPAPLQPKPDEDVQNDPFVSRLIEAMMTPMADELDPSSVVPLVIRVDVDPEVGLDAVIKHLQIVDPTQLYPETGLRREAIDRLGYGFDMPPEKLTGSGGANHWSAWLSDEEAWKGHGEPLVKRMCADLTGAYYRPTLAKANIGDPSRFLIWYDPAAAVVHPDRGKDAKDLYDRRTISKAALRTATSFEDTDKMPEDEVREQLAVQLRDEALLEDGGGAPAPVAGQQAADVQAGTPASGPPTVDQANGKAPPAGVQARILGAADLALHRARELAGSRLRSLANRDETAKALIDGVPARKVPARLGLELALQLGAPPAAQLVAGSGELIADALRLWGITDEAAVGLLVQRVEQHAARTLWEENPKPFPPAFTNYVLGLKLDEATTS